MKSIKVICVVLMFITNAQAGFFGDVGDWVAGAYDTIDDIVDPCTSSRDNKCWWEIPADGSGEVCRCDNGVI